MLMALSVDAHPQKKHIIQALSNGIPLRKIAATLDPPLHFASLQRYKLAHIRPALRNAHAMAKILGQDMSLSDDDLARLTATATSQAIQAQQVVDPYLSRIAKHQKTLDDSITDARADGDGRTVAALISTDLRSLELDAKLTGRLDASAGNHTTVYVLTPQCTVSFGQPAEQLGPVVDVKAESAPE